MTPLVYYCNIKYTFVKYRIINLMLNIQLLTAAIAREMFSPLAQLSGSVAKFFDPAALQLIILTTCIFRHFSKPN